MPKQYFCYNKNCNHKLTAEKPPSNCPKCGGVSANGLNGQHYFKMPKRQQVNTPAEEGSRKWLSARGIVIKTWKTPSGNHYFYPYHNGKPIKDCERGKQTRAEARELAVTWAHWKELRPEVKEVLGLTFREKI